MSKILDHTTKRNRLIASAQVLVNEGKAATKEYREMIAEIDSTQETIDMVQRSEKFMESQPKPVAAPVTTAPAVITQRDSKEHRSRVNAAARKFFKDGETGLNAEQRALLTTSDTVGGALISQSFDDAFIEASKFYGPIFDLVHRKDSDNGAPTKFVVTDGTNQTFSLLSEGTTSALSVAQQPTVFSDITDTDTLVSSVVYSVQELDDAFDLNSFLNRILGLAVSRTRETAITLGTTNDGSSTALPNSPAGGLLGFVSSGATTASLAAGIGYDDLVALAGSVDHGYAVNGAYMASPSVHTYLLSQKDGAGRPYYSVDPDTGLLMINGKKLYINAAMNVYDAASSPVVLFGDYSKAWNVQNAGVRMKVISNDENPALGFLTRQLIVWTRLGQSAGLSNAVKALVTAAS